MDLIVNGTNSENSKKPILKKKKPIKQYSSLIGVWTITLIASVVEIVIGLRNNSLTLLTDGFHNFSDVLALMLAFGALWASQRPRSESMTYGWKRVEIVGALMNAVFLLALCFYIVLEAIPRLIRPPPVANNHNNTIFNNETGQNETVIGSCDSEALVGDWWYLGIAITMLCVNVFSAIVFALTGTHGHSHGGSSHGHSHEEKGDDKHSSTSSDDNEVEMKGKEEKEGHGHHHKKKSLSLPSFNMNMKVVFLHQVGDSISSLFVLITALLLYFFPDQHWIVYIDPIVSLLIVAVIVISVASVLRDCAYILVQRVPEEIEIVSLQSELEKVAAVTDVHDLHVWKLADSMVIASLHITLFHSERPNIEIAVQACKDVLHKFGIHSSTLQVEFQKTDPDVELIESCQQFCAKECTEDWCCK